MDEQPPVPTPQKPFPLLLVILSVLVLLSLSSTAYLAYQNRQLSSTITDIKNCAQIGGEYITAIGRTPSCRIGPQPTPTEYTYTNSFFHFNFLYPSSVFVADKTSENLNDPRHQISVTKDNQILMTIVITKDSPLLVAKEFMTTDKQENITVESISITKLTGTASNGNSLNQSLYYFLKNGEYFIFINPEESLLQQILSTFKFTEQTTITPTPTCRPRPACLEATPRCMIPETSDMCPPTITPPQKACTMEAKLCPDGSSVGRTGPNCEFAPCPTR